MSFVAIVEQPTEYVDSTLQTASWWDRYVLTPGTYWVEFTNIDGRKVDPDTTRPYYATVTVEATLVESYRVNRVFTASSAEQRQLSETRPVHFRTYAYNMKDGAQFWTGVKVREV